MSYLVNTFINQTCFYRKTIWIFYRNHACKFKKNLEKQCRGIDVKICTLNFVSIFAYYFFSSQLLQVFQAHCYSLSSFPSFADSSPSLRSYNISVYYRLGGCPPLDRLVFDFHFVICLISLSNLLHTCSVQLILVQRQLHRRDLSNLYGFLFRSRFLVSLRTKNFPHYPPLKHF